MDRPDRYIPFDLTHTWESQVGQYDRPDIVWTPGIVHWTVPQGEVPVPVECLLHYSFAGDLIAILNYFPEGSPYGDKPHDVFLIVEPEHRHHGVGSEMLRTAVCMWPQIDLRSQAYTDSGWGLVESLLPRLEV